MLGAGRMWDAAKNAGRARRGGGRGSHWPVVIAGDAAADGAAHAAPGCSAGCRSTSSRCGWRAATVFAAPARYEPFGLGILEAALSGCALVLGDIASLRELWDGAAEFVDPDDPQALAAALDALAHAPGCVHAPGRPGPAAAPPRFRPARDGPPVRRASYLRLLRPVAASA